MMYIRNPTQHPNSNNQSNPTDISPHQSILRIQMPPKVLEESESLCIPIFLPSRGDSRLLSRSVGTTA